MQVYEFGSFWFDVAERCLLRDGQLVILSDRSLEILAVLVENEGRLIMKDEFMQKIWPDAAVEESNLTVNISKLRKVLGEDRRGDKYIVTVPRRGYRFVTNVRTVSRQRIDSVAVLPFNTESHGVDADYLADGLTGSLIYKLSKLHGLKVTPRSSVVHYKNKKVNLRRIGNKLGVVSALLGRIALYDANLTISTELLDLRTNELIWGDQYHRKISDLLSAQCEVTSEITERLSSIFPPVPKFP